MLNGEVVLLRDRGTNVVRVEGVDAGPRSRSEVRERGRDRATRSRKAGEALIEGAAG